MKYTLSGCLFVLCWIGLFGQQAHSLGTMSIDIGNEFMKVAIVKSGIPMEIALDRESQRKTPTVVSIRNNERLFGNPADAISVKYPANAYQYIPSIIGKTLDHPSVVAFRKRFPFYDIDFDSNMAQLVFKQEGKVVFTVEELMAMLLQNARDIAETHAEEVMKSAVITVPPYFGQSERRAIVRAAKLVNLDVNQLINEDTAVALHYGVFRHKSFNSTAQYILFFNMGSQSTSAFVVAYQVVKDTPELTILGVGADPVLGITEFAIRMRDYFAQEFNKQLKNAADVTKDSRAMGKLFKEAKRVVKILSANTETFAQVEYLMNEKDFKLKVSRAELEEMCKDLYDRVREPINQALEGAQIAMPVLKELVLMGGGTRMPKIQEVLTQFTGKQELGRSINTDEAAALGAVYQAAFHSPGFRVKQFNVKDFNYYSIKASFQATEGPESNEEKDFMLYKRGNPFPQNRALSVSKRSSDMDIFVNYDDLNEPFSAYLFSHMKKRVGNFTVIRIRDVQAAIKDELEKGAIMKGFKVHFEMDFSGMLSVSSIDARLQFVANATAEPSTLASAFVDLGQKISGFFSSSDDSSGKVEEKPDQEPPQMNSSASSAASNETLSENATKNDTTASSPDSAKNSTEPPKPEIISKRMKFDIEYLDALTPSDEVTQASKEKLQKMREAEQKLLALEKARNELESYMFNTRDRLDASTGHFVEHSSEEDRKAISEALDLASQWYEDQGETIDKEEYDKQMNSITSLVKPIEARIKETLERPKAFDKFSGTLGVADGYHDILEKILREPIVDDFFHNISADLSHFPLDRYREDVNQIVRDHVAKAFTMDELKALKKTIGEHRDWHKESLQVIQGEPKHKDSTITIQTISEKHGDLIREVTSYKEKYDNNRRTIQMEVRKWVRTKQGELKAEQELAKAEKEAKEKLEEAASGQDASPPTKTSEEEETKSKTDDKTTSTPRSDL